jgi:hypothetical protein
MKLKVKNQLGFMNKYDVLVIALVIIAVAAIVVIWLWYDHKSQLLENELYMLK